MVAGWTQDDVIAELAQQGIPVNHRRLTDWRQKGLLPDMEEVRDAHGHVAYVWNQAGIVAHVATVWELFAFYRRANRFAHVLWLLGYEVRPELVMEGIRAPIVSTWQLWSGGARARDDILDNISALAIRMTQRRERRPPQVP